MNEVSICPGLPLVANPLAPGVRKKREQEYVEPLSERTLIVCIRTITWKLLFTYKRRETIMSWWPRQRRNVEIILKAWTCKKLWDPFWRFYGTSEFYVLMCRMWLWSSSTKLKWSNHVCGKVFNYSFQTFLQRHPHIEECAADDIFKSRVCHKMINKRQRRDKRATHFIS